MVGTQLAQPRPGRLGVGVLGGAVGAGQSTAAAVGRVAAVRPRRSCRDRARDRGGVHQPLKETQVRHLDSAGTPIRTHHRWERCRRGDPLTDLPSTVCLAIPRVVHKIQDLIAGQRLILAPRKPPRRRGLATGQAQHRRRQWSAPHRAIALPRNSDRQRRGPPAHHPQECAPSTAHQCARPSPGQQAHRLARPAPQSTPPATRASNSPNRDAPTDPTTTTTVTTTATHRTHPTRGAPSTTPDSGPPEQSGSHLTHSHRYRYTVAANARSCRMADVRSRV